LQNKLFYAGKFVGHAVNYYVVLPTTNEDARGFDYRVQLIEEGCT
jgi:hypothetical protein